MELRVLKYFLMAAREENITRTAKLLHITQTILSRQLMHPDLAQNEALSETVKNSWMYSPKKEYDLKSQKTTRLVGKM